MEKQQEKQLEKQIDVIGGVSPRGLLQCNDPDQTILEFIKAQGIVGNHGKRVIGAQIGGALGRLVFGEVIAVTAVGHLADLESSHLFLITEPYCPVDHGRFMAKFVLREVRIESAAVRATLEWLEGIAQGKSQENSGLNPGHHWSSQPTWQSGGGGDLVSRMRLLKSQLETHGTVAEVRLGQLIETLVMTFKPTFEAHLHQKHCQASICRGLFDAQCVNACPAGVHIPGYIALMKLGRNREAYQLMRQTNPLSLVCGKICARPCEDRCRRGEIEGTVGVRALQRYVSEVALKQKAEAGAEAGANASSKASASAGAGASGSAGASTGAEASASANANKNENENTKENADENETTSDIKHQLAISQKKESKRDFNGKTIAVIGAGPGGLSTAYFLQRSGYQVHIYESRELPGGMLTSGVPAYRMPTMDLMGEVQTIIDLGVEIHYGCHIGRHKEFDQLVDQHDAVVVAVGASKGNQMPGWMTSKTDTAVDFLKAIREGHLTSCREDVVVIGGGDVAMDAARSAVRLGATRVRVVSLESEDQMPASSEEKYFAKQEGIEFVSGYGLSTVTEIEAEDREAKIREAKMLDGKVKGMDNRVGSLELVLAACEAVYDLNGRFAPVMDPSKSQVLTTQGLILAIGQTPDVSFTKGKLGDARGFIRVQNHTGRTAVPKVYAVGDVVRPGIAIQAIADAKRIAEAIDTGLGGMGLYVGEPIAIPDGQLSETTWDDAQIYEPHTTGICLEAPFSEKTQTFSKESAIYEASRCMRCDRNSKQPLMVRPAR